MSDWKFICENGWARTIEGNCYTSLYFPVEVRSSLASWLEEPQQKCMWQFDELNPTHETYIYGLVQKMISEMKQLTDCLPEVTDEDCNRKSQFKSLVENLALANPLDIFTHMKQALTNERREVVRLQNSKDVGTSNAKAQANSQSYGKGSLQKPFSQLDVEIKDVLHRIKVKAEGIDKQVHNWNARYANLQSQRSLCMSRLNELSQNQLDVNELGKSQVEFGTENEYQKITMELRNAAGTLLTVHSETMEVMQDLQKVYATAAEELRLFQEEQPLIALGKDAEKDLGKIDEWYRMGIAECLEIVEGTLQVLKELCQTYCSNLVDSIQAEIDKIARWRQEAWLVVKVQPNQIIRTGTLFGPYELIVISCSNNLMMEPDQSKTLSILINDVQAAELPGIKVQKPEFIPTIAGKLDLAKGSLPLVAGNQISFKGFKVAIPTRGTQRGMKAVWEEHFYLYSQVTVNIEGISRTLWAISLPICIATHPSQEPGAWATLLWSNLLLNQKLSPFSQMAMPPDVPWAQLIDLIDLRFLKLGKRLSGENKAYLKNVLFRGNPPANEMVSYSLFCKDVFVAVEAKLSNKKKKTMKPEEAEPTRKFTFWAWLWAALQLLNWTPDDPALMIYNLKNLWAEDKIVGFLSTPDIQRKLDSARELNSDSNPFIIRFPENRPESIGIYYRFASKGAPMQPLTYLKEDLDVLSLQERILGNILLTHLYPNIKKADAFTQVNRAPSGYYPLRTCSGCSWTPRLTLDHLQLASHQINMELGDDIGNWIEDGGSADILYF